MDAPAPVTAPSRPKRSRRKLFGVLAVAAIAIAAFATWEVVRPRTIGEVLSMEGLRAGSEISVQGRITATGRETTSYGPRVYLQLDDNEFCGSETWAENLLGDLNGSYRLGDSYQTTLRFETFEIDGRPAVWASRLPCPFPALYRSIAVVLDAVSQVREMVLVYNRTDAAGWSRYDIQSQNATGFDPHLLPVNLLKVLPPNGASLPIDSANRWKNQAARFYVMVSAALGDSYFGFFLADRMASLAAPSSANGTLRFVDADLNGLVNAGDALEVRLPTTGSQNLWETYLVRIGNWSGSAPPYGAGVHMILLGPEGPLEASSAGAGISSPVLQDVSRSVSGWRGCCAASNLERGSHTILLVDRELDLRATTKFRLPPTARDSPGATQGDSNA